MALTITISNKNGTVKTVNESGDTAEILRSMAKRVNLRVMMLARDQPELAPWSGHIVGTAGTCEVCGKPLSIDSTITKG